MSYGGFPNTAASLIRSAEALRADSLEVDSVTMTQMMEMGREAVEQLLQRGPQVVLKCFWSSYTP